MTCLHINKKHQKVMVNNRKKQSSEGGHCCTTSIHLQKNRNITFALESKKTNLQKTEKCSKAQKSGVSSRQSIQPVSLMGACSGVASCNQQIHKRMLERHSMQHGSSISTYLVNTYPYWKTEKYQLARLQHTDLAVQLQFVHAIPQRSPMYVEVIGSHGNAISPLASLPRLLPLFPLRVASFPQAHLLPPLSLRSPRVSRPPGTCKYMVAWKLKRWQIFTEHVSTNLCRARDLGSIQKAA